MGWEIAAAAILGGAQGGLSLHGAQKRNKAVRRSIESANAAQHARASQARAQNEADLTTRRREASEIRGRIRVAQADSGLGVGSYRNLHAAADSDLAINEHMLGLNLGATLNSIRTGGDATRMQLEANQVNPILSTIGGVMQGAQTGLSIGGSIKDASRAKKQ